MKNIQREDIYIIGRHSNLSEQSIDRVLKENLYNTKADWHKFLRLFFISLGVGFTVSGIIFFFAYNWADLHKFTKIGLTEALIIATTSLVLLLKININHRNIILLGSAVLVGVLFAVFGQIYQTGANAYDFFLGWTVFISLWVFVSEFAPMWILYLTLINTTFLLYSEQVAQEWSYVFVFTVLFIVNISVLISATLLSENKKTTIIPNWFLKIVALSSVTYATLGIINGIFDEFQLAFFVLILIASILFVFGISYGLRTKSGFYLSIIPFSLIVIVSSLLIRISGGAAMFLIVSLFIISSVTIVVKNLIEIQKKWANEN